MTWNSESTPGKTNVLSRRLCGVSMLVRGRDGVLSVPPRLAVPFCSQCAQTNKALRPFLISCKDEIDSSYCRVTNYYSKYLLRCMVNSAFMSSLN